MVQLRVPGRALYIMKLQDSTQVRICATITNSNLKKIHSFNCSSLQFIKERNHSNVPLLIHYNTGKFLPDNHGPFRNQIIKSDKTF